jgi:hypothetical protein
MNDSSGSTTEIRRGATFGQIHSGAELHGQGGQWTVGHDRNLHRELTTANACWLSRNVTNVLELR